MDLQTFKENFALLVDTPNGIPKLREMILDLAVRGKLVPQDPNDEPASVLVKRIAAERERLCAEGKIRKIEILPPMKPEGMRYEPPMAWEWVRPCDLGEFRGGSTPSKMRVDYWGGDIPWVSPKDMKSNRIVSSELHITRKAIEETRLSMIPSGSVLMVVRSGILKRLFPVALTDIECALNQDMKALIPFCNEILRYILLLFSGMQSYILQHLVKDGMTVQSLKFQEFLTHPFPLPPIAEQKRIVAKVDEFMALCNELEDRQKKRKSVSIRMNTACLQELTSPEPTTSRRGWTRIRDHFDLLHQTPENVAALRQSILQLAVMGKLVPQDPNDEPASVLLEKIAAEKERLIAEGKIKNGKPVPPINPNEMPYGLPVGWKWTRLSALGQFTGGGTPSKIRTRYWNGNIPWVSPKDMKGNRIQSSEMCVTQAAVDETSLKMIPKGAVLIVARSGILKRLLPVAVADIECTVNQDIKVIIPFERTLSDYVSLILRGHEACILSKLVKDGMTVQSLKYEEFEQQSFPFPPRREQTRILAKVDHLMKLCDGLESALVKSRDAAEILVSAIAYQVSSQKAATV